MGSPFLILELDVYGLTLFQTRNLNHYTRLFQLSHPSDLGG